MCFFFRKRRPAVESDPTMNFLIAGLGNIGAEYAGTRHNMGFMVLDAWAQASNAVFTVQRYGSIAEISFKGRKFILLKPSTYMNLSGNAVRYWMQKLNIPTENLLVICDDLNLPFGTLRMRKKGSDGGHNGLKNIEQCIGTSEYTRIRIGIGNDFNTGQQIDFVLGPLNEEQKSKMPDICDKCIEGVKAFATIGTERAMNFVNSKAEKH
jgi:PTH1 family peptidyl-tRNA hydrolase